VQAAREPWQPTSKGRHLSGRRTTNTVPEVRLRSAVHRLGLRFRLHTEVAKGCTPDFVLPRWATAVFVDGCFWHGCPSHSPASFRGPNAALWREKLSRNRERDRRNNAEAAKAGWKVVRVWECEIKADAQAAAEQVRFATTGSGAGQARSAPSVDQLRSSLRSLDAPPC
jgi:DNA mismatch endonuclease, patch repair protein